MGSSEHGLVAAQHESDEIVEQVNCRTSRDPGTCLLPTELDARDESDDIDPGVEVQGCSAAHLSRYDDHPNPSRWERAKRRLTYYVPIMGWLPRYDAHRDLATDLSAALAVASIIIPQSLSHATTLIRVDPMDGIFTAAIPCITYAFLGTSRQLSAGPEALISIITGAVIRKSPLMESEDTAATLTLLVGVFTFLLGFFRLAFIDSILSRAMLRGFINAVALVIAFEQLPHMLGLPQQGESDSGASPLGRLIDCLSTVANVHVPTTLLAFSSVTFLASMSYAKAKFSARLLPYVPAVLIAAVVTSLGTWALDWDVQVLGPLSRTTAHFGVPLINTSWKHLRELFVPAALISVLGVVEGLAGTKLYAMKNNYTASRNRDLVAFGAANIISSFFNAFASFASLPRSKIYHEFGARSQLSGLITGLIALLVAVTRPPFFQYLPQATMSAIIFVAAVGLLEFDDAQFLLSIKAWRDLAFMVVSFAFTLTVSIEAGIIASLVLSLLMVVKKTTMPRLAILGKVSGTTDNFTSMREFPGARYANAHVRGWDTLTDEDGGSREVI